jgi:UDP-GlcNAc:undecaprenyl-phosphate GlcNAc-1-phosphate transferase
MLELLVAPAVSFGLCLLLTPLVRRLAHRVQLVDKPDGRRKLHGRITPVAGGLAIFASVVAALAVVLWGFGPPSGMGGNDLLGLLLAGGLIVAVGVADDFGLLRGRHKLLGQILAVAVVMAFGVHIRTLHLFDWEIDLGLLAVPFTAFVLLGAINSLNLIDGMDGLLSSVGLMICVGLGAMALVNGHVMTACVAFALAGALLGFLRYNFPPASIFLGDSGSMLIGLTVGVLAIQSALKGPAAVALATPGALLIIPILDTTAAILRRKLTGRSIYSTDRSHLHHCLLNRGLGVHKALLIVSGCCLLTVIGTLASLFFKNELVAVLSALTVVAILALTRLFGHTELGLVVQRLRGLLASLVHRRAPGVPRESEWRLQGTVDWKALWVQIVACGNELNLRRIRLDVNAPAINEGYHARWDRDHKESEEAVLWKADLPLAVRGRSIGQMEVVGERDDKPVWRKLEALARLVQECEARASLLTDGAWGTAASSSHRPADVGVPQDGAAKAVFPAQAIIEGGGMPG